MGLFETLVGSDIPRKFTSDSGHKLTIEKGSNGSKSMIEYEVDGNSKQEYITIDGVQYKIPDGYTLLEYATSDGTAYVDTGYVVNYTDLTLKYKFLKTTKLNLNPLGVDIGTVPRLMHGNIWQTSLYYGDTVISTVSELALDIIEDITFEISNALGYGKWTINGTDYSVSSKGLNGWTDENTSTNTTTDYLFATNNGTQPRYIMIGNLYYARYYKNNTELERAFYFLKKDSDNSVVCYDFVTKTFPTIIGTLTAGLEAPTPSQPVEIQSCGDLAGQKNQLVQNGNFESGDGWSSVYGTVSVNNNEATLTLSSTSAFQSIRTPITLQNNHYYYVKQSVYAPYSGNGSFAFYNGTSVTNTVTVPNAVVANTWSSFEAILQTTNASNNSVWFCVPQINSQYVTGDIIKFKNCIAIDLTQMFGAGNEPSTVADAKAKIAEVMGGEKDYYAYNAGTDYYKIPVIAGSNCGCVDLGSLTWNVGATQVAGKNRFFGTISDITLLGSDTTVGVRTYCKYSLLATGGTFLTTNDGYVSLVDDARVVFYIDAYSGYTAEQFKKAMSGVYLYYQRTTDTSWTTPTTTNIYLDEPLRKVGNYIDKIHFGQGKNLVLDTPYKIGYAISASGVESVNSAFNIHHAYVNPSTEYTYKSIPSISNYTRVHAYDSTGTWISQLYADSTTVSGVRTATFTTPSNCTEIRMQEPTDETDIQLEQGSSATKYQPYSDTPQVIRNVGEHIFDGTENWLTTLVANMFSTSSTDALATDDRTTPSTHFKTQSTLPAASYRDGYCSRASNGNIAFGYSNASTIADWTTYLAGQYNANTPVKAIYPITPTSEVISLPTLTPAKGTTIYTVPTKVQPFVSVNLFDKDNTTNVLNAYINGQGVVISASTNKLHYIEAKPNTTYTFSSGIAATFTNGRLAYFAEKPAEGSTGTVVGISTSGSIWTSTFTTASDTKYIAFHYGDLTYNISSIQIQEGSSATTYEPYCNGINSTSWCARY